MLACPDPLLTDDPGDPELGGLKHALLFKKLPRQPTRATDCSRRHAASKRNCFIRTAAASSKGRSLR
jgi:hypothetical protein